jgi:sugar phosphate isomerase/epimerase
VRALLIACLLVGSTAAAAAEPFMKGMVVSCPWDGRTWGKPAFGEALEELKRDYGVGWVQVHPYAWVGRDGEVRAKTPAQLGYLEPAVEMAKARGVKMLWKPHLGYWGRFSWRGAITYEDEAHWMRFFREYRTWMLDHARFAEKHKLPVLVVGTELEKMLHRPEWRPLIAEVRKVYKGKITWAANWDGVGRVPFWDALDYVGVQAYFPLGQATSSDDDFRRAFRAQFARLVTIADKAGNKPVMFTEVGFPRSPKAAAQPWVAENDGSKLAIALRARLLRVALDEMKRQPRLVGAFWWKWMPGFAPYDADFSMKDAEARGALKASWTAP